MLVELKHRFLEKCIDMPNRINALCPESKSFLQSEHIQRFSSLLMADFSSVCNGVQVHKLMLKDRKSENIADLYVVLLSLKQPPPTVVFLRAIALIILISSTTCERMFSKMKLTKTKTRKGISD